MGLRYRKTFPVAPGVCLNVNARSVSLTGGVPGAHLTYNSKGYRTASVGAPGTGLSYRTTKRVGRSVSVARAGTAVGLLATCLALGTFIAMVIGLPWWGFAAASVALGVVLTAVRTRR